MEKIPLKQLAMLTTLVTTITSTQAQEVAVSAGADFVSSYIWRGKDLGGISVQPTAALAVSNFSLTAWGSAGFDSKDVKEFDFTLGYNAGKFTAAITDYWFNTLNAKGKENSYYNYAAHETAHVFEATAGYDFGAIAVIWNTCFAGADYYGIDGKRSYSTYIEAGAPFKLGGLDMKAELGITGWDGMYSSQFDVVNMGITVKKNIHATDSFSLPAFTKVVLNPAKETCRFVFGITF